LQGEIYRKARFLWHNGFMFKLFGKKNKKTEVGKKANGEPMSSEEIRAQAMANAKAARESIGEETLEKIAAALQKKQQSTAEKAKAQIRSKSPREVAEEILAMRSREEQ